MSTSTLPISLENKILLTREEVADLLRICQRSADTLIRSGAIRSVRIRAQEYVLGSAVAELHKRFRRAISVHEIAKKLEWKSSLVYKQLKRAVRKHLVRYEGGTREHNVKRVLPIDQGVGRFLPSPRSVLKHYPELGKKVKYVDPLSGKWKAVRK